MTMQKSKSPRTPRLTLHQLLGTLSFWGGSTRLLLVAFLVAVIFAIRLLYLNTTLEWEAEVSIYILASFALLDIGYVILARAFPLRRRLDVAMLLLVELFLVVSFVLPNLAPVSGLEWFSTWSILIVLLVLGVRGLLGMLFTTKRA